MVYSLYEVYEYGFSIIVPIVATLLSCYSVSWVLNFENTCPDVYADEPSLFVEQPEIE